MESYTFVMTRTYETIIEIDAKSYNEALYKLQRTDVHSIEMEQCCCVEESIKYEDEIIH
jgi:hypothetical protein